jgi:hypothetical protein
VARTIPHVSDNDRPVIDNQLSADFDCVYKISEGPGMWTIIGTNLNLGVNDEFRDFIIAAAERTGVDPACLTALIDIEAAKTAAGAWDVNSRNQTTTASGPTQFVQGTWRDMARDPTTFLNAAAKQRNLVDAGNAIIDDSALLDLRFDAQCSIMTAADYGATNLRSLMQAGLIAADASDETKARVMYLAHHDGLGGARAWLTGQVTEQDAERKLIDQIGSGRAAQAKVGFATWVEAYLAWIYSLVRPDKFAV